MGIDKISGAAVDALIIITAIVVVILMVIVSRRRHVTISEVSNGTGQTDLNKYMNGASTEFRLAVGREMENTVETVHRYHEKVLGDIADRCYALDLPEMKDALINHQDDTLDRLAASLESGSPQSLALQLQTLGGAVAKPRGATVTATIYQAGTDDARLGISVEVVSPGSRFAQRHLLSETRKPGRKATIAARIETLLQPAARCAAIELAAWVLQRRPRRFSLRHRRQRQLRRRSRQQEGLAWNMAGLLMNASAESFPDFANQFYEFALDEFKAAKTLLPNEYQPHYNLAAANEAVGKNVTDSNERYGYFATATIEYGEAAIAGEKLQSPGKEDVLRKIRIGRLHAELVSKIPRLKENALKTLMAEGEPDVAADWPGGSPGQSRWRARAAHGVTGGTLDDAAAECLYNSACVYALAAEAAGHDYGKSRDDWDRHARRLLGAALVRDGRHRYLWHRAGTDRDLGRLAYHFEEFTAHLREDIIDDHPDPGNIGKIIEIVDKAAAETGWAAHAQVRPRRPWAVRADALRRVHMTRGA